MLFPFDAPVVDLSFTCKHCGQVYYNTNGRVEVCMCPGAERERVSDKERQRAFDLQQAAAQPTLLEVREQRKLRTGKNRKWPG